jgi:hypothetical protein
MFFDEDIHGADGYGSLWTDAGPDERAPAMFPLKQILVDQDIHRPVGSRGTDAEHQAYIGCGEIAIARAERSGADVIFYALDKE